jgi:hypothetical protein
MDHKGLDVLMGAILMGNRVRSGRYADLTRAEQAWRESDYTALTSCLTRGLEQLAADPDMRTLVREARERASQAALALRAA